MTRSPEDDIVEVEFIDLKVRVNNWTEYELNQNFLTPTDGWRLVLGDVSEKLRPFLKQLKGGEEVAFRINGLTQMHGYVDTVDSAGMPGQGTTLVLEGRDSFSPLVDGGIDPRLQFRPEDKLSTVLARVLGDYGWDPVDLLIDNQANREIATGGIRGTPMGKAGKKKAAKPLKSYQAFRAKPHDGEGAYEFLARICTRFGLHLWPSVDGTQVIVGAPDFNQTPGFKIRVKDETDITNVRGATARRDWGAQPSAIVATARGDGNFNNKSNLTYYILNELVAYDARTALNPAVSNALDRLPNAKQAYKATEILNTNQWMRSKTGRVMYLHDNESATADQLKFFLRRELAHMQRRALTYRVELYGHTQNGHPWAVDTMVDVDDDYNDIHEPLWVMSRTLTKSVQGGTMTHLEMIRPGTLEFQAPESEGG